MRVGGVEEDGGGVAGGGENIWETRGVRTEPWRAWKEEGGICGGGIAWVRG